MPDISMCNNYKCPSRLTCYRFLAEPSSVQTYALFEVKEGEDRCSSYWEFNK